jgi:cadmium resistance protein CadD (predicted permease)
MYVSRQLKLVSSAWSYHSIVFGPFLPFFFLVKDSLYYSRLFYVKGEKGQFLGMIPLLIWVMVIRERKNQKVLYTRI